MTTSMISDLAFADRAERKRFLKYLDDHGVQWAWSNDMIVMDAKQSDELACSVMEVALSDPQSSTA